MSSQKGRGIKCIYYKDSLSNMAECLNHKIWKTLESDSMICAALRPGGVTHGIISCSALCVRNCGRILHFCSFLYLSSAQSLYTV